MSEKFLKDFKKQQESHGMWGGKKFADEESKAYWDRKNSLTPEELEEDERKWQRNYKISKVVWIGIAVFVGLLLYEGMQYV